MSIYDRLFPPKKYTLSNGKEAYQKRSRGPLAALIIIVMTVISVKITGFSMTVLVTGMGRFWTMLGDMFPPNFSYMSDIWKPLFDTIKMSLLGSVIGALVSVPFAVLASTNVVKSRFLHSSRPTSGDLVRLPVRSQSVCSPLPTSERFSMRKSKPWIWVPSRP